MTKKQLAQAGILAAMITGVLVYLVHFHPWLLITGIYVLVMFMFVFFFVVLVWTKGAIIPHPFPMFIPGRITGEKGARKTNEKNIQ